MGKKSHARTEHVMAYKGEKAREVDLGVIHDIASATTTNKGKQL